MAHKKDLTGKRFGRIVVIKEIEQRTKNKKVRWLCKCDCGAHTVAISGDLNSGHKKSCGCLSADRTREANTTHGKSNSHLYKVWQNMIARCKYKTVSRYKNYGGRGIKIMFTCFEDFHDWAIDNGYQKGLSIERIDNNGPYSRDNCKWIPLNDQAKNKTSTRLLTHPDTCDCLCIADWDKKLGFKSGVISQRIQRGWPVRKALETPLLRQGKNNEVSQ